jgi:O-antigen ligase/lipopolysaccharide biosynthesis regulator YciM
LGESIIAFSKMLSTFIATCIIAMLVVNDKRLLKYVAIAMVGLLIFDAIRVFSETIKYIKGEIKIIGLIKAGYANKNILAAALFIKLPFALWLFTYEKKYLKYISLVAIAFGVLAVFFMSARAFYLGTILVSIIYISFALFNYFRTKNKSFLKDATLYTSSIIIAFAIFSVVQSNLYPKSESTSDNSVVGRISSITKTVDNDQGRLTYWKWSGEMIKENPITGVGIGNWKIKILEKENRTKANFLFFYKVHNDFIEISTETGILGGLLFISIFFFIIFKFLKSILRKENEEKIKYLFLPAFGIMAYTFDAFFNFPHDRPEIQTLFALFVGIAIALHNEYSTKKEEKKNSKLITASLVGLVLLVSGGTAYALNLNHKSLKLQWQVEYEKVNKKDFTPADELVRSFPKIPNLDAKSDPIDNYIAWKYNKEGKFDKTVKLLTASNPSPYNTRREFYLSYAYSQLKKMDSALHYIELAKKLKPKYFHYTRNMAVFLRELNRADEGVLKLDEFLKETKNNKEAWEFASNYSANLGDKEKAYQLIDSASNYFPNDARIKSLKMQYSLNPNSGSYQNAQNLFNSKKYKEAIEAFKKSESFYNSIGGFSNNPSFLNFWGRSHLELNEINEAKELFNRVLKEDRNNFYANMNLGNIAFHNEKDYKAAEFHFTNCTTAKNSNLFLTYKNLGTVYLVQQKSDEAISSYENALKYGTGKDIIGNLYLLWKSKGNESKMAYYKAELDKLK